MRYEHAESMIQLSVNWSDLDETENMSLSLPSEPSSTTFAVSEPSSSFFFSPILHFG
jgi:hypothetical protein